MFKKFLNRFKKSKGTEILNFNGEVAYRNYVTFIRFYSDMYATYDEGVDIHPEVAAHNLFRFMKNLGQLDELNYPVG